jgi:hypothetical protein
MSECPGPDLVVTVAVQLLLPVPAPLPLPLPLLLLRQLLALLASLTSLAEP